MTPPVLTGAGLLDALQTAVAAADPDDFTITYENVRFRSWFPPKERPRLTDGQHGTSTPAGNGSGTRGTFPQRVPGFDAARARERLERNRPYRIEVELKIGPRVHTVSFELRRAEEDDETAVVAEAVSITKQKEAEYMLDSYSKLMERQARELEQEKERAERLLLNIMPPSVVAELRDFGTTTPQSIPFASVLMLDFVDFTEKAISRDPGALIAELNDLFTSFDRIISHCRGERIKTIGDAYMAVAGVPESDPDHEYHLARAALRMRRFIQRRNTAAANQWRCRIGIASGPMIGSIVGVQKYIYDVFGPPVNLATRLESMAEPMQILITAEMAMRLQDSFVVRAIGTHEIKGFGRIPLFALEDEARPVS